MRGRVYTMAELMATDGQLREWAYNALDCTGTRKVWDALEPRLNPRQRLTYAFHRSLQAPCLAMMRRGVLVDQGALAEALTRLKRDRDILRREVNKLPEVGVWDGQEKVTGMCPAPPLGKHHKWQKGVPDSPERKCVKCGQARVVRKPYKAGASEQDWHLLYDLLHLPVEKNKKGEESVDDEVLEKLEYKHPTYAFLISQIREARDFVKQIGFLSSRLTPDGRMPSSFNVAAAWTSRFSSSKNPYGLGTNLQNISEKHRHILIADPGRDLFYADLERAESLVVAYVSGDEAYIKAHDGDTHTMVARLLWPELPWVGDEGPEDKKVAEALPEWDPAPGHTFRFQAKRIQHGSNFGLSPKGIALIAHIPQKEAIRAQGRYFEAFPGIRLWQNRVALMVSEQAPIVNPLGYEVSLFGRPWDGHTVRQALSLVPQSTVAHVLNLGLRRCWRDLDPQALWLLAQVHDAILGSWLQEVREQMAKEVKARMLIPIPVDSPTGRRTMTIPVEIMAGKNWGKANTKPEKGRLNPNGMRVLHV